MQRNHIFAIVAGCVAGLGLHGVGMYFIRKSLSPEFATQPIWHNHFTAATMLMVFTGFVMLAVLFVFTSDDGKDHPNLTFLRAVAVWLVIWAIVPALF